MELQYGTVVVEPLLTNKPLVGSLVKTSLDLREYGARLLRVDKFHQAAGHVQVS